VDGENMMRIDCRRFPGTIFLWVTLSLSLWTHNADAHTSGSSFLSVQAQEDNRFLAQVDFDLRDLNQLSDMDANQDGDLSWGEIRTSQRAIESIVLARTSFTSDDACAVKQREPLSIAEHGAGPYARLTFDLICTNATLQVNHSGWFAFDPGHRALLEYTDSKGQRTQTLLSQQSPTWHTKETRSARLTRFLIEGVTHLVTGYDHLAFLLVLLLALMRTKTNVVAPLRLTLRRALIVVTAFTLAHSLTLALAATGHVVLPSRPVEVIIAASVAIAALLNLSRGAASHGWKLAFSFGLVHGLGFAGALAELTAERIDLLGLAAFNIGIELAQLAIALSLVPLMWLACRDVRRERIAVPTTSIAVACVAAFWVMSRLQST
jgi:HupE / UreJ protein